MKAIFALLSAVLLMTTAAAQPDSEYLKTRALQFSVNGLNLGSINAGVGGKVWTTERTALALSIAGIHTYDKSDPNPMQSGTTLTSTMVQLQIGLEWHTGQSSNFSPYIAGALFARYEHRQYEYSAPSFNSPEVTDSKKTNVGLCFGLGAEYWITQRLSLSGQHLFQVSYTSGTQEYDATTSSTQATHGFNVGLGTSSLVLSLCF
jgi:opacity protein-like surface antigen